MFVSPGWPRVVVTFLQTRLSIFSILAYVCMGNGWGSNGGSVPPPATHNSGWCDPRSGLFTPFSMFSSARPLVHVTRAKGNCRGKRATSVSSACQFARFARKWHALGVIICKYPIEFWVNSGCWSYLNSPIITYYEYIIGFAYISVVILYSFDIIIYAALTCRTQVEFKLRSMWYRLLKRQSTDCAGP